MEWGRQDSCTLYSTKSRNMMLWITGHENDLSVYIDTTIFRTSAPLFSTVRALAL